MKLRYVMRPRADQDIEEIGEFFAEQGGEPLVVRFLLAVGKTIDFMCENPKAGSPRFVRNPNLEGLRSWPVSGFDDIRLYYLQPDERTLRVIRVLHGKRDIERILRQEEA